MQNITPCLWFNSNAEEAVDFYVSIFKNSRINETSYYPKDSRRPAGDVLTISFELDGLNLTALNGDMDFPFNPAVSLQVPCDTQEEIDRLWDKLTEGGETIQCGWVSDKYGLSWQIFPKALPEMLADKDEAKAARVMQAMMKMVKIDLPELERVYKG